MNRNRQLRRSPAVEPLEDRCVPAVFVPTTFDDGGAGSGSLRDAILSSNANPEAGTDIILLQAGTYRLTLANDEGQENAAVAGDLDLTSTVHRVIIFGAGSSGPNATIIDATELGDRVFHLVQAGVKVVLLNLIVTGGVAVDDGTAGALPEDTDAKGGGVLSEGGGLDLFNVVVANNAARGDVGRDAFGGGLHAVGGVVVSLGQTRFEGNVARGGVGVPGAFGTPSRSPTPGQPGGDAQGGGAYVSDGVFLFLDTTFAANVAEGGTGGEGGRGRPPQGRGDRGSPGAPGGAGGAGQGGGVFAASGIVSLTRATLAENRANGGDGGSGGVGSGMFRSAARGGIAGVGQGVGTSAPRGSIRCWARPLWATRP